MSLATLVCILGLLNAPQPTKTAKWFLHYSKIYEDVPIEIALAISYHESKLTDIPRFNPSNDWGIMQVNRIWEDYCKKMFNRPCDSLRKIYCGKCRSIKRFQDNIRMGYHVLYLGINKPGGMIKNYNSRNPRQVKEVSKALSLVVSSHLKCLQRFLQPNPSL
jgi:hypothetical protein